MLERFADELEYVEASEFKPQSLSPRVLERRGACDATEGRRRGGRSSGGTSRARTRPPRARDTLPTLAPDAISPEGLSAVFMATLALNAREQLVGDGLRDAAGAVVGATRGGRRGGVGDARKTETRPCRSSRKTSLGRSATWGWRTSSDPFAEG